MAFRVDLAAGETGRIVSQLGVLHPLGMAPAENRETIQHVPVGAMVLTVRPKRGSFLRRHPDPGSISQPNEARSGPMPANETMRRGRRARCPAGEVQTLHQLAIAQGLDPGLRVVDWAVEAP